MQNLFSLSSKFYRRKLSAAVGEEKVTKQTDLCDITEIGEISVMFEEVIDEEEDPDTQYSKDHSKEQFTEEMEEVRQFCLSLAPLMSIVGSCQDKRKRDEVLHRIESAVKRIVQEEDL